MWLVYCHQNRINGKKYIGITSRKPENRWGQFGQNYGFYFGNAIAKYGWDNFEHYVIYSGLTKDEAVMFEQYFIEEFNTKNTLFGYNLTAGGDGMLSPSSLTLVKLSKIHKGHKVSEETRRKLSESNKGKHNASDETRAKISARNKGKVISAETRAKISKNCGSRRPEVKAKISKASLGRPNVNKGRKFTEEEKAVLYATRRGKHLSEERKAEISVKLKAYYASKKQNVEPE